MVLSTGADTVKDDLGERVYFDSLHFAVVRRRHNNGKLYIEAISDKRIKVDLWKEFYENGQLKEVGKMTTSNHHHIGEWKYYSYHGNLDSIVDYEKKFPISYYGAIEIARENGFIMPDIEVQQTYSEGRMYWEIHRWSEIQGGRIAETIIIDSKTGKARKADNQLIGIN